MNALVPIEGAKGGVSPPYEAPNSLRAKQILHAIFLLGEGPAKGLWDGGKSIFFGDPPVPLVAADGSANVLGVEWALRDGSPGQTPFPGIPAVETLIPVGVRVTQAGGPIIRSVDCANVDRIKFITTVPALVKVDANTGDQLPTSVSYTVEWREAGTNDPWLTLFEDTISGKCVAPYPRMITVVCPAKTQLEFRMVRITPDSNSTSLSNDIFWTAINTITDRKLEYPGCFMVAVGLDAEQFGSELPPITFGAYGLLCWVPANYDPETRTYATSGIGTSGGIWDGSFKRAYTNNPAWIFYTLCVDEDFGVGRELAGAVDKWTLYTISQYCDELVPDGFGGQEPRYTFNAYINTRDEAIRVLQAIAQSFRGMVYWGFGQVVPVADMPVAPKKLVTPANVIDGRFEYEGSSLRARHNVVKVRWRDPSMNYRENIEVVQDAESIATIGMIREVEIDGIGCTSRGLARRMARWVLYTEKYESEMVRYRAFRDHLDVSPGDVVLIQDPKRDGISMSGRLLGASATTLILDRTVKLLAGNTYSVRVQLPDGTMSDALPVLNSVPSETDSLTLGGGGLPTDNMPEANHVWMLVVNGNPTAYRILDISEERDETYTITALRYYAAKFDHVENGLALDDEPWTIWPSLNAPLPQPTNLEVQEYLTGVGVTTLVRVIVSWTPSNDPRVRGYEVQAISEGIIVRDTRVEASNSIEFPDLAPGPYIFQVRAFGENGLVSAWAATDTINVDGRADAPPAPSGLAATGAIRSIIVNWTNPTTRYLRTVEVWASSNSTFGDGGKVGESPTGRFTHDGLMPETTHYYWIRAVDLFGQASDWVGPVSATTSYLIAADIAQGIIDTAKFAQGIQPVLLIDDLNAVAPNDTVALNKEDGKLYTRVNGEWVATIQPLGPNGTLSDEQIAQLDAAKLIGTLPAPVFPSDLRPVERVNALPTTGNFEGRVVYLTTDNKIYRHDGTQWTSMVPATDLTGTLPVSVFSADLRPIERVTSLPSTGNFEGRIVYLTTDDKIYRYTGSAWISTTAAADITGQLNDAQIASLNASKVTGQLSDSQIAQVNAAKVTGQITGTQISDGAISTPKLAAGAVTANELAANAVTAAKIAASAVTTAKLEAGAVTTAKLAAGAVTANEIASGAVTTAKLAAGAVTANELAANAVTAGKIAAGTITSAEIATGSITADRLLIGDFQNLVENPWLDAGSAGYILGSGWSLINDPLLAYRSHGNVFKADNSIGTAALRSANVFPVNEGEKLTVRALVRADGTGTGSIGVAVVWRTAASGGGDDGTTTGTAPAGKVRNIGIGNTDWTWVETVVTVPAGKRFAQPYISRAGATGIFYATHLFCSKQAGATLIEDGAIITEKIAANAVTAGKIAAGAISAAEIAAGTITGDKLAIGNAANLIWNPTCFASTAGWVSHVGAGGVIGTLSPGLLIGSQWGLPVYGSGRAFAATITAWCDVGWRPQGGRIPVKAGQRYEFQALVVVSQASVRAMLIWYDASGAYIGQHWGDLVDNPGTLSKADAESDYTLAYVIANAPANAAYCVPNLRMRGPGDAASGIACYLYWTKALFGEALPNQNAPSVWNGGGVTVIDGGVIRARTLAAEALVANSITATELAAGSITAEKLAVGPASGNVIWNSCCAFNVAGWAGGGTAPPTVFGAAGLQLSDDNWRLANLGTGGAFRPSAINAGQFMDMYWLPGGGRVPVQSGEWWEWSARVQAHRCDLQMKVAFYSADGVYLSETETAYTEQTYYPDGKSLANYRPLWGKVQVPAGAAMATPFFRAIGLNRGAVASDVNPYLFFTQAQFCRANANQTEMTPWAPGGVTEINGGMIRTASIVADHLNAGAVTAGKLAADAVTAGTIAAGAVSAREIAAGAIKADKLAAEEILTDTIQVRNLIIGSEKITANAVSMLHYVESSAPISVGYNLGWQTVLETNFIVDGPLGAGCFVYIGGYGPAWDDSRTIGDESGDHRLIDYGLFRLWVDNSWEANNAIAPWRWLANGTYNLKLQVNAVKNELNPATSHIIGYRNLYAVMLRR